jgi:hypothetical protein
MISGQELAYEAARTWALHPISHPPAGWAQILRSGIASFVRERQAEKQALMIPTPQTPQTPGAAHLSHSLSHSPLLTLVAAMITEVCQ